METLKIDTLENLLIIKLNRPETLNAITTNMLKELNQVLSDAQKNNNIKVILITGEGKGFCSGQDLKEVENLENFSFYEHLINNYNPLILKMRSIEKPIVIGINGTCAGAGLSLALAGDIRIAKRSAKFTLAFGNIGLITDSGSSYFLVRSIGISKTLELLWTNEIFDSQKALELGIINKIFEDDEFDNKIIEFCLNLSKGSSELFAISKRFYNRIYDFGLNEVLELEAQYQETLGRTNYFKEKLRMFLEKKK